MSARDLTPQSFNQLLAQLSPDRDEAAKRYEDLRRRLIKFFAWRRVPDCEEQADEVLNRISRKVAEKTAVQGTMESFALGIAQFVYRESLKKPRAVNLNPAWVAAPAPNLQIETESACLERCLDALGPQSRRWVEVFYQERGRAGTRLRESLAAELGIDINALRVRLHRIRAKLEACLQQCLSRNEMGNEAIKL